MGGKKGDDVWRGSSREDAGFALRVVRRMSLRKYGDLNC